MLYIGCRPSKLNSDRINKQSQIRREGKQSDKHRKRNPTSVTRGIGSNMLSSSRVVLWYSILEDKFCDPEIFAP